MNQFIGRVCILGAPQKYFKIINMKSMEKNVVEQLFTLKYADRKGEGSISLVKPLKFSHGIIDVKYEYDPELSAPYCLITCIFDEGYEEGYEDNIAFYSGDTQLLQIRVKNQPDSVLYQLEKTWAEYYGACTPHILAPIVKAQNLNVRIVSRLRKYKDVHISGSIMEDFQKALQALLDLLKDKNALAVYISERDESFKSLYKAQEEERKKQQKKGKRKKKKTEVEELAQHQANARNTKISSITIICILVFFISIGLLIGGMVVSSTIMCWLGFVGIVGSLVCGLSFD